jgi:hypothetical protein
MEKSRNQSLSLHSVLVLTLALLLYSCSSGKKISDVKKLEDLTQEDESLFDSGKVSNSKKLVKKKTEKIEPRSKSGHKTSKNAQAKQRKKGVSKEQELSGLSKKESEMVASIDAGTKGRKNLEKLSKEDRENIEKYEEWDKESAKLWSLLDPKRILVGETFSLHISYLGFSAATVKIQTHKIKEVDGTPVYHFSARAKSSDYYKWVYELDDLVNSYVTTENLLPIKYTLLQDESSKKVVDIQLFDRENLMTHFRYKRTKKGKEKIKSLDRPIPRFHQDLFSTLFFIRSLPLAPGASYKIPTVTKGKAWISKVQVVGRETIEIQDIEFKAIKLFVVTEYDGELAKRGKSTIWLSDDRARVLLKFASEAKIGSVKGEIFEHSYRGKWLIKASE